jgi:hypothetical protein
MIAEKHQRWQVLEGRSRIDAVLTEFVARRVMKVTHQRPGLIEVKGGSALAAGKRAQALDWLPVKGQIAYTQEGSHVQIEATIGPRGRPHVRRHMFEELYEHKLTSWLADLDRTLRSRTESVEPAEPSPTGSSH